MRERWFGATGRRVPEIAVEGELDLGEALVLDGVDEARLRDAHDRGQPVVVRAASADDVRRALAHPGVASAIVPADRAELRDLDLTELTYGG
jgi:hypothetical protein